MEVRSHIDTALGFAASLNACAGAEAAALLSEVHALLLSCSVWTLVPCLYTAHEPRSGAIC
jgi:hypothetical protein